MKKESKKSLLHVISFFVLFIFALTVDSALSGEVELKVRILEGKVTESTTISASGGAVIEYGGNRSEVPGDFVVSSLDGGKIEVRLDKGIGEEVIFTSFPLIVSSKGGDDFLSLRVEGKLRPYRGNFLIYSESGNPRSR